VYKFPLPNAAFGKFFPSEGKKKLKKEKKGTQIVDFSRVDLIHANTKWIEFPETYL
jgi:hypothetical protein